MRSLQVLTPHKECIFKCPFCISETHEHNNTFINNYKENKKLWESNLIKVIKENDDLECVVITGTSEPMQDKECVKDVIKLVRKIKPNIQIEIQTRYYIPDEIYNMLDVVAYSISDFKLIKKINPRGKIARYVFILTDTFNGKSLDEILEFIPQEVKQVTFKVLHDSNGFNEKIDQWIYEHRTNKETIDKIKEDVEKYNGEKSIRFDEFCMDADGRYKVFREDGKVYKDWETEECE